jgi:hypothetical protein
VANWLRHEFVTPYPVDLRVEKIPPEGGEKCFGDVRLLKGRLLIRIDPRVAWETAIEILLHEYAHCHSWMHHKVDKDRPHHSDEWGLAYARIYRRFNEEGGDIDAGEYPWRAAV